VPGHLLGELSLAATWKFNAIASSRERSVRYVLRQRLDVDIGEREPGVLRFGPAVVLGIARAVQIWKRKMSISHVTPS
jgi:hypothetical protein